MDEKKNLTPNAIEDDKLDEVAGGRTFNMGDMTKKLNKVMEQLREKQEAEEAQQP